MPPRSSKTKVIASNSVGVIPYKVVRTDRHTVCIIVSQAIAALLRKKGADLTRLKNIGNRRARKVMTGVLESVQQKNTT